MSDDIVVNKRRVLPLRRYLAVLERLRALIAGGLPLGGYDDEGFGYKNTECTWGLCQQDKATWPDPQDYIWPDNPERIAPLSAPKGCRCPMDTREVPKVQKSGGDIDYGCFYHCRFFQGKKSRLTREQALELYDARIAWAREQLARQEPGVAP